MIAGIGIETAPDGGYQRVLTVEPDIYSDDPPELDKEPHPDARFVLKVIGEVFAPDGARLTDKAVAHRVHAYLFTVGHPAYAGRTLTEAARQAGITPVSFCILVKQIESKLGYRPIRRRVTWIGGKKNE